MGFVTFGEFRTDLQTDMGSRNLDPDRLGRWVNYSYLDLASSIMFEVMEDAVNLNTNAGLANLLVPEDAMMIKLVRNQSSDTLLGWLPKIEYFRRPSTQGAPLHWSRHGNQIYLNPVPDSTYQIRVFYQKTPAPLSADTDVSALPDAWDTAIHLLSVYHGLLAVGEEQRASLWYARAVNFIQTRMTEDMLQATSAGIGLSIPPIQQLDIRPFAGQLGES